MPIRTLHQTDLFHPHADPDDHWDLACQFALAYLGHTRLDGILVDHPPDRVDCGDPAIASIHQLGSLTGLSVPCAVGIPSPYPEDPEVSRHNGGIRLVLRVLAESPEPVTLHIVGSCRDVAIAGLLRPDLFRDKCRAIYLNAGSARSDEHSLEYNVQLDPLAFHRIFRIPCPIYWMPCFEAAVRFETARYGTYYRFRQREILPFLSNGLRQYFLYALDRMDEGRWLGFLSQPADPVRLDVCGDTFRNMWCTGGFFHAAGLGVTRDGAIRPLSEGTDGLACDFFPVEADCADTGVVTWTPSERNTGRYLFEVQDPTVYPEAMIRAMRTLLSAIPG